MHRRNHIAQTKKVITMIPEKNIKDFLNFLKSGSCTFTVTEYLKQELNRLEYKELLESEIWKLTSGKYYVTRNDASIIAFNIGKNYTNSFNIITSHSDTPAFMIKPENEIYENGYLKINVAPYGGLLNYGWLDRPLSIAGKIIIKENDTLQSMIIDLDEPLLVIPSLAIHLKDSQNSNLDLNTQTDLCPIISLTEEKNIIRKLISKKYHLKEEDILDFDLLLYNKEEPLIIGQNKDILLAPRIDNLTSTFAGFKALTSTQNDSNINVFCSFNSEEIGSLTKEGADSNFLIDTLKRISASIKTDIVTSLFNSIILSSDNTHAVHPNNPGLSDDSNKIYLNKGIVISKEMISTTDSLSSSIVKTLCEKENIPYQYYTSRNDLSSGSTLAGISLRHVSATSIDIGLATLAMHSSIECVGSKDINHLINLFTIFYQTSFQKKEKSTKIIF